MIAIANGLTAFFAFCGFMLGLMVLLAVIGLFCGIVGSIIRAGSGDDEP